MKALSELRNALQRIPAGKLNESAKQVESLLAAAWNEIDGTESEKTHAYKLIGRMENTEWHPPLLTFSIERHGGTCMGSTRADLHHWTIDVESGTATVQISGYRQLSPRNKPLKIQALVKSVIEKVQSGEKANFLVWKSPSEFRLLIGQVIPDDCPNATLSGRRKRFSREFDVALAQVGWKRMQRGQHSFQRLD